MGLAAASTLAVMLILLPQLAYSWRVDLSRLREQTITIPTKPSENLLGVPIVDPPTRVAGYFRLDRTKAAEMFYFFFQARKAPASAPLVLWMTGGPGCSSELAVLYENGPYTLDSAGQALVETEYGWDVTHNMIFVDQPIGTGFSYTTDEADTVYDESGVAEDMLDFLQHFFAAHPDLAGRPFYITGESYAGHYVPAVSHRVWLSNTKQEGPHINLKGLAVGNGLTDPAIQYNAYGDFALANNLIGKATRMWMSFLFPICRWANAWCDSTNWDLVCALGMQYCVATQFEPILAANPGINVYDITKKCDGQLCYDFTAADKFLNSPATRAALGVGDRHWVSCSYDVYENFMGDWLHRFDTVLPDMMADGIRVMIYAGDLDLICNFLGNRRWVDALDWAGAADWDAAGDEDWVVQGRAAGKVKSVGPLTFVQVYKAGHMVPMDQGLNGLAMITAWTRNLSLTSANDHLTHDTLPRLFDRLTQPAETASETTYQFPKGTVVEGEQDQSTSSLVLQATRQQQQQQQQQGTRVLPPQHGPRMSHFVSKMTSMAAKAAAAARQAAGGVAMAARKLRRAF